MGNVSQTRHTFGRGAERTLSGALGEEGDMRRIETFPRVVTVSRQCGAGGSRIAEYVAAELGFQLWDHELVMHLARKADTELELVRALDERERDLIDDVLLGSLHGARLSGCKYRGLLTHFIADLAERGAAVIVGRAATFLVRREQALRVRVVCPFRERVQRYGLRERLDWARAVREVRNKDRQRERFTKQLSGEDEREPDHYDLLVNTLELSDRAAAGLIVASYRARFSHESARGDEARSLMLG